ncbi:MAG: Ryanodine receptor Ryr [Muribaculaceae bacterium]|nr:Ryanodine receptor Ryr [Muribaculaceae bacterium]
MKADYIPQPVDLSGIELPDRLMELAEMIARNVHDTWAVQRMAQGWTYGPQRDDNLHQTPCLVDYDDLPEDEKEYDRATALSTLKLIRKLGFDIVPRS